MKILPLFGLRKNSFLTLLFYRFLPLIGRFFCFSFLFVTAVLAVSSLMETTGMSVEQALTSLKIAKEEWPQYMEMLEKL